MRWMRRSFQARPGNVLAMDYGLLMGDTNRSRKHYPILSLEELILDGGRLREEGTGDPQAPGRSTFMSQPGNRPAQMMGRDA
jgi:hypothetical protein